MVLHLSSALLACISGKGIADMPSDCCAAVKVSSTSGNRGMEAIYCWLLAGSAVLLLHLSEEAAGGHGINLRGNTKGIYFYGNLLQ